ncbi:MAG: malto-oligosyltrehalose trehalohydrolase [Gemmatimonadales bacterium]
MPVRDLSAVRRRLPIGAEVRPEGIDFRVWAPRRARVEVVLETEGRAVPLAPGADGYFHTVVPELSAGTRYRFRLDGGIPVPDPASRFQPGGPHGPSEVIDPAPFAWSDAGWHGAAIDGQVCYEVHVGTFTPQGTWTAAADLLPALADVGVTLLEVMPVAEFPGRFGWGYDGVNLFAPTRLYGRPDDFRRFVDRAHSLGLGVLLDVVYNHLGPDGNYLREFSDDYFTDRYTTPWGQSLHFDGDGSAPIREFFLANAAHWIAEYHLDGLRLDATHTIYDASPEHILAAVARRVRETARGRATLVIAEDEPQRRWLLAPPSRGGWGMDAIWHDEFHHSARVAATGRREGYLKRFTGTGLELAAAAGAFPTEGSHGHAGLVNFLQNHDQLSVMPGGRRLHQLTSAGRWRALTALLLLGPGTPMLFQGDEFAASAPFFYFADHEPTLARLVREGRARYLAQFASLADPAVQALLPDPADAETFRRCQLDHAERGRRVDALRLHRDLVTLRRSGAALNRGRVESAALSEHAIALRTTGAGRATLLLVNLGTDLELEPGPGSFVAAPRGAGWSIRWSSDDVAYGGSGIPAAARRGALAPGESALLLEAPHQPRVA